MSSFIFQSVAERFDLRKKILPGKMDEWQASQYAAEMNVGDIVFFWMAGDPKIRGIYGWGEISSPAVRGGVGVIYKVRFSKPILATELRHDKTLAEMQIFHLARGTNFPLNEREALALVAVIEQHKERPPALKLNPQSLSVAPISSRSVEPSRIPDPPRSPDPPRPPDSPRIETPTPSTPTTPEILQDTTTEGTTAQETTAQETTSRETKTEETTTRDTTTPFYADHPAQRDLLNRKAVADTIATMVQSVWRDTDKEEQIDRSFIVHLHGRWGSGKTSILNFLAAALLGNGNDAATIAKSDARGGDQEKPAGHSFIGGLNRFWNSGKTSTLNFLAKILLIDSNGAARPSDPAWIIVNYNAWRNQGLGPAWWTLMEAVYTQAREQFGDWLTPKNRRLIARDVWWRIRSSHAPIALATLAIVTVVLWLSWDLKALLFAKDKSWFSEGLATLASSIGIIVAIFTFGQTYRLGSARTAKSYLELSRDPVSPLIKRYGDLVDDIGKPVAVFIDDLDRCNGEFVVELLQTIQTLFRNAKVLYVVAADRDWVCSSYQQQYTKFSDSLGEPGKSLGHLFVEKVFQLSVEVPRLGDTERDTYWDQLIDAPQPASPKQREALTTQIAAELENATTESAISETIERYRSDPDRAGIVAAEAFKRLHTAPLVKEREHFLRQSKYRNLIEPNPRAMKRLLNAYGFRRGFDLQSGRKSDPDALVRWTILENRWPILADYLEGRSSGLKQSEIIESLKKDAEVLKVAEGLTWEKLRPVPSAPDQPPSPEITPGPDVKV